MILADEWQDYLIASLRETKERDRQPLGGTRPNSNPLFQQQAQQSMGGFGFGFGNMDDSDIGVMSSSSGYSNTGDSLSSILRGGAGAGDSDDEGGEDEFGKGGGLADYAKDGDVASDQVSISVLFFYHTLSNVPFFSNFILLDFAL